MNNNNQNDQYLLSSYRVRPTKIIGVIIAIIMDIIILGLGVYFSIPNKYDKYGIETKAIIQTLDGGENGYPTVKFEVEGIEYFGEISFSDSSMEIGNEVKIRYMKDNPNDFKISSTELAFNYIFFTLGTVLLVSSILLLISYYNKSLKRIYTIKQNGTLVKCTLEDIKLSNITYTSRKNHDYTYCLIITCKDKNGYCYKQKNYYYDVVIDNTDDKYGYVIGDQINVYISNKNPKKYAIDFIEYQERKHLEKHNTNNNNSEYDFD